MKAKSSARSVVLIASPSRTRRRRWRHALQLSYDVVETNKPLPLESNMSKLKPAILLLDLSLPHLGGTNRIRILHRLSPLTKILVLCSRPDPRERTDALKAGARGYAHKEISASMLKRAIKTIERGEFWARPELIPEALAPIADNRSVSLTQARESIERLTPRRREIADMVAAGASNKEIASRLRISEGTVKAYLTAIFRTLQLSDRLELAVFMIHTSTSSLSTSNLAQ